MAWRRRGAKPLSDPMLDYWTIRNTFQWHFKRNLQFLAATKQLYERFSPSVCPSVRLSVCLSHLFNYVPTIASSWNFHELLPMTEVMCRQKVKIRGHRSRSQRSTLNTQLSCFRTVTVWIHIRWWNDTQSLILLRKGALLVFKAMRKISRSRETKDRRFWPKFGVSGL